MVRRYPSSKVRSSGCTLLEQPCPEVDPQLRLWGLLPVLHLPHPLGHHWARQLPGMCGVMTLDGDTPELSAADFPF